MSAREKAELFSILSIILKTGVSLPLALEGQVEALRDIHSRFIYTKLKTELVRGKILSESLKLISGVSDIEINLIKAAEKTGTLPTVLNDLSIYNKNLFILTERLKRAFVIPAATFTAACFIASLPALARYGFGRFIAESLAYILAAAAVIILLYFIFSCIKRRARIEKRFSLFLYSLPLWGRIEKKLDLFRFSRILSLSISAGLNMADCLSSGASAVNSFSLKQDIYKARYLIEKRGMTLQEAFSESESLSGLAKRMLAGGEISGTMGESMGKLSDYLQEELTADAKVLVRTVSVAAVVSVALFIIFRIFMLAGGIFSVRGL